MLECLIIGDSIAVGTKQVAPTECVSYAHSGWNSWQWNKKWGNTPLEARTLVISLGSNDWSGIKTEAELRKIRARTHARVIWILPHGNNPKGGRSLYVTNDAIKKIARDYGDRIVEIKYPSKDNIHPSWRGYKQIVKDAGL